MKYKVIKTIERFKNIIRKLSAYFKRSPESFQQTLYPETTNKSLCITVEYSC